MAYSRNFRNRMSNDQGQLFERLIDQACWYYRNKGLAMIEKTPEPFRVKRINKDNTFTGWFTGNAQPDYKGTVHGGRALVFEAKFTSKDRIKKSVVTGNQAACLDIYEEMGALVGVCCMIGKTAAFIPWGDWKQMKELFGRQYLLESELVEEYQVPTPGYIDFLHFIKQEERNV
ncbi:Holliday junction resolvase RecU [Enterococcus pallens]|uniref:Holliday junction resolvase RecU n=1 Tax=Enterococcus pallens ATCC BAA-351 TaxID=1158607 RepID=R2T7Z0_9ENTE|nr:Holliday junction resolvase RecU [Enterococcus pallens]EOH96359.1 hypothetical protein UAU_01009 [Enterococcus pallens ATCC BAA-351]EOU14428.1 hypothetical protein I588_04785 [Enterococcus pallens ATCC BAA-351]